jgi:transposase
VRDDYKITRDHTRLLTVHQDKDYRIVFDTVQLQTGLSCGIGCYDYVGSPGFFDELFFALISHFHHLVADKIYTGVTSETTTKRREFSWTTTT